MKSPIGLVLVLLMAFAGCSSARDAATNAPSAESRQLKAATTAQTETIASQNAEFQQVSLTHADTAASSAEAADRKIIRNANLTLEVKSTSDMQHKVTSIAESHGGFVVTSEAKQREDADPAKRSLDIKLVVRVPSDRFGSAMDLIRSLATTLREENVSGQDVTEELIDLESRIWTQRALALQLTEMMKQARKLEDALEVLRQVHHTT